MANSVDPDQSDLAQTYLSENLGSLQCEQYVHEIHEY